MTRVIVRPDVYAPSLSSNSAGLERHSPAGATPERHRFKCRWRGGRAPGLPLASLVLLLVATAAHAGDTWAAGDAAVEAPIRQFTAAINMGDVKAALATHIAAPAITDEVAPYLWSGPKALDKWFSDLGASEAAEGIAGDLVSLGTPSREEVSGSHAYVVWPATFTYNRKSVPMRETAQWTFTLVKQGAVWKIASWAWSAPPAARQHP